MRRRRRRLKRFRWAGIFSGCGLDVCGGMIGRAFSPRFLWWTVTQGDALGWYRSGLQPLDLWLIRNGSHT